MNTSSVQQDELEAKFGNCSQICLEFMRLMAGATNVLQLSRWRSKFPMQSVKGIKSVWILWTGDTFDLQIELGMDGSHFLQRTQKWTTIDKTMSTSQIHVPNY